MGVSRVAGVALAGSALLALSGCRQSRIGDAQALDVCGLVTPAEATVIFGTLAKDPAPLHEGGFAGGCAWSFAAGSAQASVSAYVMTAKSASDLLSTPKGWFEDPARVGDAKANLGEPSELKGLGYVAWLYGTTLFVRKGETVIVMHTERGDVAQMERLASTLLSPR